MDKYIFSGILIATLLSMVDHRAPFPQNKPIVEPAVQQSLSVGQQIQLARIRKGFSQKYLARLSGVSHKTIRAIEKGNFHPTLNELHKIQEIIGGGIVINGDTLARL